MGELHKANWMQQYLELGSISKLHAADSAQKRNATLPPKKTQLFQAPAKRRQNPAGRNVRRHTTPQDHDGVLIQRLRTTTWTCPYGIPD